MGCGGGVAEFAILLADEGWGVAAWLAASSFFFFFMVYFFIRAGYSMPAMAGLPPNRIGLPRFFLSMFEK